MAPSHEQYCAFAVGLVRLLREYVTPLPAGVTHALDMVERAAAAGDRDKLRSAAHAAYAATHAAAYAAHATNAAYAATNAAAYAAAYAATNAAYAATNAAAYAARAGVPPERITTLRALTIGT